VVDVPAERLELLGEPRDHRFTTTSRVRSQRPITGV